MATLTLKQQVQHDIKQAMLAKDQQCVTTLRLLTAAIKQQEVDQRIELQDSDVVELLSKMLKQRQDAEQQYQSAGRVDLAEREQYEIGLLSRYLPPALSETEVEHLLDEAIQQLGATDIRDMGKVMAALKPQLQGRFDMALLSQKVKAKLKD